MRQAAAERGRPPSTQSSLRATRSCLAERGPVGSTPTARCRLRGRTGWSNLAAARTSGAVAPRQWDQPFDRRPMCRLVMLRLATLPQRRLGTALLPLRLKVGRIAWRPLARPLPGHWKAGLLPACCLVRRPPVCGPPLLPPLEAAPTARTTRPALRGGAMFPGLSDRLRPPVVPHSVRPHPARLHGRL